MRNKIRLRKTITLLILVAFTMLTTSCTSYRVIKAEPNAMRTNLNVGDSVKIITKDGQQWQFIVVEIRADSLFSAHRGIAFDDVAKIESKTENDSGRHVANAFGIGFGILGAAFLLGMVSLAVALDDLGD